MTTSNPTIKPAMKPIIKPIGDQAALICFGDEINPEINSSVMALQKAIEKRKISGVYQTVPSFTSLMVCYDPCATDFEQIKQQVEKCAETLKNSGAKSGNVIEIPVCYGNKYGEDLAYVAQHAGLSEEEVITIHSGRSYRIYMIGFLPGFPYLGGLDERIFTPRLESPRTKIPEGSVGIGGEQTGIYPMESPGGWQLIGRTPLKLYRPEATAPLYETGDEIRFVPISEEEFEEIYRKERAGFAGEVER